MNSKKKLTKAVLVLFLFFIHQSSFAQADLQYTQGSSGNPANFRISAPPINPNQTPRPYYTTFLEMGNGYYKKDTIFDNVSEKNISYLYNIQTGSKTILTVATYYDTTPRPPRNFAIANISNNSGSYASQSTLSQDVNIRIDPSVATVVPGDTIAVAINYKQPSIGSPLNIKNIVAFFYNNTMQGGSIYNTITENTLPYDFKGIPVNPIRVRNGETPSSSLPSGLPQSVTDSLSNAGSGYQNALYFSFPQAGSDISERNIFLSLGLKKDPGIYTAGMTSSFKAVIIQYNNKNKTIVSGQNTFYNPHIDMLARDPNGITTLPRCIDYNRIVSNTIFFQNDGNGLARTVETTVYIPIGMEYPPENFVAYGIAKGEKKRFQKWVPGTSNHFTYELRLAERKIVFRMEKVDLAGGRERDIKKRKGSIIFKTKVIQPEPCMYTTASIVFINAIDNSRNPAFSCWDMVHGICVTPPSCPGPWIPPGQR